jgi:hypothetical protein
MRWYKVKYGKIEPVEVIRETPAFVVVKDDFWNRESRVAKRDGWHGSYHPTFQAAKLELIAQYSRDVVSSEKSLVAAKINLSKANALEEPK